MKIAVLGDLHWGARNDNQEFLNYFQKFFDDVFFPEISKRNITKILQVGDFVDRRKFISYVTLNHIREHVFVPSREFGYEWDILVGNHDVPYKNTNEINSLSELFSEYPDVRFFANPTEVEYDGVPIFMIPWINSSNISQTFSKIGDTKAQVAFGHLELTGFEMQRGVECHGGTDPKLFNKFELVVSGHFHTKSSKGNILYTGTPYEITWSDYDEEKGFHIFDTDTRELEFIRNPHNIFHKIWYNDSDADLETLLSYDITRIKNSYVKVIVQSKENPIWFETFMSKIYEGEPLDVSIVDDHYNLDEMNESEIINEAEDTLTILSKYIAEMEHNIDKEKLDKLMRAVYNEAISLERVDD